MASAYPRNLRLVGVFFFFLLKAALISSFEIPYFRAISRTTNQFYSKSSTRHNTNVRCRSDENLKLVMTNKNTEPDLSPEDKQRGKLLADAWIRQDKSNNCAAALQVMSPIWLKCFERLDSIYDRIKPSQGKSVFLVGHSSKIRLSLGSILAKRLGSYR